MKKLVLIIVLVLNCQVYLFSQSCLPEGITFSTQAKIDSFLINYPNCTMIEGDVIIGDNSGTNITNLNALSVLVSVDGSLRIHRNDSLPSLTGLDNLTSIGGHLSIGTLLYGGLFGNYSLTNLVGLDELQSIGGGIYILGNRNIQSLSGLENLDSIGDALSIEANYSLMSLSGIDNIVPASITGLYINNNSSLSTCEIKSVCGYLANPNGDIEINNNAYGCNNQIEVEEACEAIGLEDIINNKKFLIFPNPTTNRLNITNNSGLKIETISIYNQLGQKVLSSKGIGEYIDISFLEQGIFIIELTTSEIRIRKKLIIKE